MVIVPLAAVPNQSLSVQLNNQQFDLRVHDCGNGVTAIDITINEVVLLTGTRIVGNYPIIPVPYMENGNFILQTANQQYPDYTRFGVDQFLLYATQAELEAI